MASTRKTDTRLQALIDTLLARYRADPEGFRAYLPEVAQALDALFPPSPPRKHPFGLTERERAHRQQALQEILHRLGQGGLSRDEAVRGLEHCAVLIQDDSLPTEVGHELLIHLLRSALGKSPTTFRAKTVVSVREEEAVHRVSILRGVVLDLTWDMRLVSVTIHPHRFRERKKALEFVGIGRDTAPDVARRHDDYLTEGGPFAPP